MTIDNISIMCRNSLFCSFLTGIVSKVQIFFVSVFVIINGTKHVQTYGKSRYQNFAR